MVPCELRTLNFVSRYHRSNLRASRRTTMCWTHFILTRSEIRYNNIVDLHSHKCWKVPFTFLVSDRVKNMFETGYLETNRWRFGNVGNIYDLFIISNIFFIS